MGIRRGRDAEKARRIREKVRHMRPMSPTQPWLSTSIRKLNQVHDDVAKDTSDITWTPKYAAPNLLQDKLGESLSLAVTAICIDEEVLDWGDDNDDGMGTLPPIPNQSFHRMSF